MPVPRPRSLADDLRARDDESLAELLARRPDLVVPVPPDITALATAAAGRLSVQRAVDGLDTPTLQVLEILAALPEPASPTEVTRRWGAPAGAPLATLRALGLLWGPPRTLRLVRAARDVIGPHPAGLGPPLADALGRRSPQRLAELLEDLGLPATGDPEEALRRLTAHLSRPDVVASLLRDAPDGARTVLDRLVWGPPVGSVADADRPVRAGSTASPVEWLLAHGLIAVADAGHVVLPREIGLALRGGTVHRAPDLHPPPLALSHRLPARVDGTAAAAAVEAVRLVEELCLTWGESPPPVLRAGGLGVRDLRRTAQRLEVDNDTAALTAEVALAAGLIADDGEADPRWLPTPAFDTWRAGSPGERWGQLAIAWLHSSRAAGLVGGRSERDGPIAALGPDMERPQVAEVRRRVLHDLADGTEGGDAAGLADGVAGVNSVIARLEWSAPRRHGPVRATLAAWALREAAWLGLTGAGALSRHGRLLLVDGERAAADALDQALPSPVDHVLLQADLTAVAPGPLESGLAHEMALAADIESRGAATVYRFTAGSVRRALDAGRTGDDLLDVLQRHSRTPVPQPLRYLVEDTARRYGRLRVGAASAYLRADDDAVLSELLADRRTAGLRLRRLAPTVLAAQADPETVLAVLRDLGLTPAAETPDGDLLVRRPESRRARRVTPTRRPPWPPPAPSRPDLLRAVRRMREAGRGRDGEDGGTGEPNAPPLAALAVLREAVGTGRHVWLGYLEGAGHPVRHMVEPLAIEAGRIRAVEQDSGRIRHYAVHRVITVTPAPDGSRSGAVEHTQ